MNRVLIQLLSELSAGKINVVDLTKPLGPLTPVISLPSPFGNAPPLKIEPISQYDKRGPAWYWNVLHISEHTGTHFDAPVHWITGRHLPENACDTIAVKCFVAPAVVIDCSEQARHCADYLLGQDTIIEWERKYDRIPAGSWVLMRTDWSKRTRAEDFLNVDEEGAHSPGFHWDATKFLLEQRDILGIGVETVGIDPGLADRSDPSFQNHALVLGAGKFGLASLYNLSELPPVGTVLMSAPLKIIGGSGSPVRVLGLVEK